MFYKKNKRSMRKHLILFAFLWFNFHGAFRVCVTPPKWKQLIPQFGFGFFFQIWRSLSNENKISMLKISGYKIGCKISTKREFEWRSIVYRIENQVKVFCKHCIIKNAHMNLNSIRSRLKVRPWIKSLNKYCA